MHKGCYYVALKPIQCELLQQQSTVAVYYTLKKSLSSRFKFFLSKIHKFFSKNLKKIQVICIKDGAMLPRNQQNVNCCSREALTFRQNNFNLRRLTPTITTITTITTTTTTTSYESNTSSWPSTRRAKKAPLVNCQVDIIFQTIHVMYTEF